MEIDLTYTTDHKFKASAGFLRVALATLRSKRRETGANGTTATGYRPDIDGFRALAVALVVVFHAGAAWLPGGFVGVDVFFVISGYLITGLLIDEYRRTGRVDLQAFWARRVRRLGPALFLVIAVTLPASMVWLSRIGTETQLAARAALATLLLNANHLFMLQAGDYFAAAGEMNALLHMWSLSVEEQFYFVWPLSLLMLMRLRKCSSLPLAVGVALAIALGVGAWGWKHWPAHVQYYLMPARAWELLAGGLLAVCLRVQTQPALGVQRRLANAGAALGLGLIGIAAFGFSGLWGFPFPLGLAPVAGTVLLIWAGAVRADNPVSRLAARPWVVYLGRISYPLYLWHWPLLVLTRGHRLWEPSPWADAVTAVATVLPAALTYELVEKPWQVWMAAKQLPARRSLQLGAATTAALLVCAGLVGAWAREGWGYAPQDRALAEARTDFGKTGCIFDKDELPDERKLAACYPPARHRSILLWGDSHAGHWGPAIRTAASQLDVDVGILALGGCMPLPTARLNEPCQRFDSAIFQRLGQWQQDRGLQGIVLAARWASGMGLVSPIWRERVPKGREVYFDARVHSTPEALAHFESALAELLDAVTHLGLRVLIVMPSPLQRIKGPHCLSVRPESECFVSVSEMTAYAGAVEAAIGRVAASRSDVRLFDPKAFMCSAERCPARLDGRVVYADDNHVTETFARASAPQFLADLAWLAGVPDGAKTEYSTSR